MRSIYASEQLGQVIWPDFANNFKSESSVGSYLSDINEFMDFIKKDFLILSASDVNNYYNEMKAKVTNGDIQGNTMAKKFKELHSFAMFIIENRKEYCVPDTFRDFFFEYLGFVEKQEKLAKTIPLDHMDRLLAAAQDNLMAYCILVLLQRVGMTSTDVIELKPSDFAVYDNGVYAFLQDRERVFFIPDDVYKILEQYMQTINQSEYLFVNSRGNPLNTMYISRLLKKYTQKAGVPSYSAESIRNSCAAMMFAYGVPAKSIAAQMGTTMLHINRYKNMFYKDEVLKSANNMVKVHIDPPIL